MSGLTRLRRAGGLLSLVVALLFTGREAAAAPIVHLAGVTTACFGSGCTTFATSAASSYGLDFVGLDFDVFTDGSGAPATLVLGTFERGNLNVSSALPELPFTLQILFTLPAVIDGGQEQSVIAEISGTNSGGGGKLDVDFENSWQLLQFANANGFGSFEFGVFDDLAVNKNGEQQIVASIRNARFSPASSDPVTETSALPEPAALVLMAGGLAAAVVRGRRRV